MNCAILWARRAGDAPEADYVECDHGCQTFDDYHVDVDGYLDDSNSVGAEEEYDSDEQLCEQEEKWGGGDVEHPFITIAKAEQQRQVSESGTWTRKGSTPSPSGARQK